MGREMIETPDRGTLLHYRSPYPGGRSSNLDQCRQTSQLLHCIFNYRTVTSTYDINSLSWQCLHMEVSTTQIISSVYYFRYVGVYMVSSRYMIL